MPDFRYPEALFRVSGTNFTFGFATLAGPCTISITPAGSEKPTLIPPGSVRPTAVFRLKPRQKFVYPLDYLRKVGDDYAEEVQALVALERGGVRKFRLPTPPSNVDLNIKLDGDVPTIEPRLEQYPEGKAVEALAVEDKDLSILEGHRAYIDSLARGTPLPKLPAYYEDLANFEKQRDEDLPFYGELFIINDGEPILLSISSPGESQPYLFSSLGLNGVMRTSWGLLRKTGIVRVTLKTPQGREHTFYMDSWDPISTVTIHSRGRWPPEVEVGMDYKMDTGRVFRASWDMLREAKEVAEVLGEAIADPRDLERLNAYAKFLRGDHSLKTFGQIGFRAGQLQVANHHDYDRLLILTSLSKEKNLLELDIAGGQVFKTDWSVLAAAEELREGDPLRLTIGGHGLSPTSYDFSFSSAIGSIDLEKVRPGEDSQNVKLEFHRAGEEYDELARLVDLRRAPVVGDRVNFALESLSKCREMMRKESLASAILMSKSLASPPSREYLVRIREGLLSESKAEPKLYLQNSSRERITYIIEDRRTTARSLVMTLKGKEAFAASWRDLVEPSGDPAGSDIEKARLTFRLANGRIGSFIVPLEKRDQSDSFEAPPAKRERFLIIEEKDGAPSLSLGHFGSRGQGVLPVQAPPVLHVPRLETFAYDIRLLENHQAEYYRRKAYGAAKKGGASLHRSHFFPPPIYPISGVQPQPPRTHFPAGYGAIPREEAAVELPKDALRIRCTNIESPGFAIFDRSTVLLWRKEGELLDGAALHRRKLVNDHGRPKRLKLIIYIGNGASRVYSFRALPQLRELIISTNHNNPKVTVDAVFQTSDSTKHESLRLLRHNVETFKERARFRIWQEKENVGYVGMLQGRTLDDRLEAYHSALEGAATKDLSPLSASDPARPRRSVQKGGGLQKKGDEAKGLMGMRLQTGLTHERPEAPMLHTEKRVPSKRYTRKEGGAGARQFSVKETEGDNDWKAGGANLLGEVGKMDEQAAEPLPKAENRSHSISDRRFVSMLDTLAAIIPSIFPALPGKSHGRVPGGSEK